MYKQERIGIDKMNEKIFESMEKYQNEQEIIKLCKVIEQKHKKESLNEEIFHYTTHLGLYGILSSGNIRAANYSYLNDSTEIKYGADITKKIIDDKQKDNRNKDVEMFLTNLESMFWVKYMLSNVYVLCFSQKDDLLSQWRAYGSKQGRICIGFKTAELVSIQDKLIIAKVVYSQNDQIKKINHLIDDFIKFVPKIKDLLGADFTDCFNVFFELAADMLLKQICFFKDQAFHEEEEVRVVKWFEDSKRNIEQLNFKTTEKNIIPYINIIQVNSDDPDNVLPITKIIIGPSLNKHKLFKVTSLLLYKYGYAGNVSVRESSIPFEDQA